MAKSIQMYQELPMKQNGFSDSVFKSGEESDCCISSSSSSSSSSCDLEEDTSSSSPSFSPMFHLSELMAQLPIKRGLSKYYDGKSESFTSFASVGNLEDLAKKGRYCSQRIKSSRSSDGWGLGDCRRYGPKTTIIKRASTNSKISFLPSKEDTSIASCRNSLFINKKRKIKNFS